MSKLIRQKSRTSSKQKLYCYVDESGQDTNGKLFVVGLVVTGDEKEELEKKLIELEKSSGKKDKKWQKARKKERLAYISGVIDSNKFGNKLFYSYFDKVGVNYYYYIIFTLVKLFSSRSPYKDTQVVITIDALDKRTRRKASAELRSFGIKTNLVRGKKDESSSLLRLADAVAGFVRDGIEKHSDYIVLFNKLKREHFIRLIK